jgi:tetratricopeptide (TPR) repeat protein
MFEKELESGKIDPSKILNILEFVEPGLLNCNKFGFKVLSKYYISLLYRAICCLKKINGDPKIIAKLYDWLGHFFIILSKEQFALEALRSALQYDPDNNSAVFRLGIVLNRLGSEKGALDLINGSFDKLENKRDQILALDAMLYCCNGNIESEIGYLQEKLKLEPDSIENLDQLGKAYVRNNELGKFKLIVKKIVDLKKESLGKFKNNNKAALKNLILPDDFSIIDVNMYKTSLEFDVRSDTDNLPYLQSGEVPSLAVNGGNRRSGSVNILQVQVLPVKRRKLIITGLCNNELKDAAKTAYFFLCSNSVRLQIPIILKSEVIVSFPVSPGGANNGCSCGLSIALGIFLRLRGLTLRRNVAVTGTISLNGEVGSVSGIDIKVQSALEAGYNSIIMPSVCNEQYFNDVSILQQMSVVRRIFVDNFFDVINQDVFKQNSQEELKI